MKFYKMDYSLITNKKEKSEFCKYTYHVILNIYFHKYKLFIIYIYLFINRQSLIICGLQPFTCLKTL